MFQYMQVFLLSYKFPGGASGKEPACNAGDIRDAGSIPGSGRSPAGGCSNPLCIQVFLPG